MKNELINNLENLIDTSERLKGAYFWNGGNASSRDYTEKKYSVEKFEWNENGDNYSAEIIVKCSRANVYVTKNFTRNSKKTTLTAIKNSYKRLVEKEFD